jgi:hypothetical protein
MRSYKIVLTNLHHFLTFLGAKYRAADVAADMPPTHRRHTADIAADAAADVEYSERSESDFPAPTHMIAYPQNIAP